MADLEVGYWVIIVAFVLAFIIGLIYMLLLRFFAGILCFVSIVAFLLG
jgi:hypothetical protein